MRDTRGINLQTVDYIQRLVGCRKRRTTTNTNLGTGTRNTTFVDDIQTGHFTREHVVGRSLQTVTELIGLDSGNRTGQVVLLGTAITDHHYLLQELGVFAHSDDNCRSSLGLCIGKTDVGYGQSYALWGLKGEITVDVGHGHCLCSFNTNSSSDHGIAEIVLHMSIHSDLLSKCTGGKNETEYNGQHSQRHCKFYLLHHF